MIGVPEAHRHFGSTIGGEVLDVLHTLGVSPEKIGYFTLDNAANNDTAMEVIGAELGFDGRLRRGRSQWEDEIGLKRTGQVTQPSWRKNPHPPRRDQLTDKDWEVLYHLEAILTVFETVVKTLEGDGHIRRRKQGWTGSYGNIWDVVLGYELLLNTLEEYKQLAADFPDPEHFRIGITLLGISWMNIIGGWTRRPSTIRLWHCIQLIVGTGLMKRGLISLNQQQQRRRRATGKRPRFFNPFEKNSRLPSSIPPYAAAIVVDEYQAWQTDREASDGTFVIQSVTGSLSKADILGYPGWPWTS
ncbi:hypothetical protein Forpi1262_v010222 [Fusarium oxysporum f. sp. raphani]|uniref:Uncharacterized protein n=1 Tax=Fusarium oxysporum f. sp. raphani TaxID=96318 RepID=A0A8J5PZ55_FUSOX|nr:hypothetical protein Forpi1262_v010222 [Fusarium oxysporum f. sp. raphani]